MFNSIDKSLEFGSKVLELRAYRQQLLASNIANADTPNYKAVDIDFAQAMRLAQSSVAMESGVALSKTSALHLDAMASNPMAGIKPLYRAAVQPSIDGNTVDTDIEMAQYTENALQYMSTVQFLNGKIQSTLLALRGN